MLDSPDLKGRRTDTSSDDIWQQEKVLERFCNHAGDAVMTDQIDFSAVDTLVTGMASVIKIELILSF